MTRYVLCGGAVTWAAAKALGEVHHGDVVLVVPWATPWAFSQAGTFRGWREDAEVVWPGCVPEMAYPGHLKEQLQDARLVALPGGDSPALIRALREEPGLDGAEGFRAALDGKSVLAISAGVSALTKVSYNADHCRVVKGLGLVDAASVVHYPGEEAHGRKLYPGDEAPTWRDALAQLGHSMKTMGVTRRVLLRDHEFAVAEG